MVTNYGQNDRRRKKVERVRRVLAFLDVSIFPLNYDMSSDVVRFDMAPRCVVDGYLEMDFHSTPFRRNGEDSVPHLR